MSIPHCLDIVERLKREHPDEWAEAHTGRARTEDFIRRLAWVLHSTVDERFGLLGQRGSASTIADDAVLFRGQGPGHDPSDGNRPVSAFDVIVAAGSPDARPGWGFINEAGPAVWVKPSPVAGAVAPPVVGNIWTARHQAIREKLGAADTRKIAEQFAYSFPGEGWGQKRVDGGRPISNDVIARTVDGVLYGMRVVPMASGQPFVIQGQMFVPVPAVNHIQGTVPVPMPPPSPISGPGEGGSPTDRAALPDYGPRFDILDANLGELTAMVVRLAAAVDAQRQEVIAVVKAQSYDIDANVRGLGKIRGSITPKP